MRSFLSYVVRSRSHATVAASVALILPLLPTSFISAGIIGLVTLRQGPRAGAWVLGGTLLAAGTLALVFIQSIGPVLLFAMTMGIPVFVLASVLRASWSQGVVLAVTGLMGSLTFCAIHLLAGNSVIWWRNVLDHVFIRGIRQRHAEQPVDPQALELLELVQEALPEFALGTYLPALGMLFAMLLLLLARWWHAILDNPGGFGREFRALKLDRRVAFATVGVAALAIFAGGMADGLTAVLFKLMLGLYMIQGVAIAHSIVAQMNASAGWLVTMYLALWLLKPLSLVCLALAGFSDTWLDYRSRWQRQV